ncbi:hypothetical protein RJ641_001874 [Dillenia turbinata]|uniref:Uncharacterized protein n=1 Tax=Dillenia turbinata TaxID=194707 RepID=A0AAN8ZEY1_9MAGN
MTSIRGHEDIPHLSVGIPSWNSLRFFLQVTSAAIISCCNRLTNLMVEEDRPLNPTYGNGFDSEKPAGVSKAKYAVGFTSKSGKTLNVEMEGFELGKVSYLMILVWTAICWQFWGIGAVGLLPELTSVFANAISTLALPIVAIFAMIFIHENLDGVKGISMFLAVWGFVPYACEHYLDDCKSKSKFRPTEVCVNEAS